MFELVTVIRLCVRAYNTRTIRSGGSFETEIDFRNVKNTFIITIIFFQSFSCVKRLKKNK